MRVIGIDLAWGEGSTQKLPNESGLVAVDQSGVIVDAAWASGLNHTVEWIERVAAADSLLMIDAPLVVSNDTGQRLCERQVGQRYGRWKVSANSTNRNSRRLAGVGLARILKDAGWRYHDGRDGVRPTAGKQFAEVYPYTTLVGAPELGYRERPVYKRKPRSLPASEFRARRAENCDDLVDRLAALCNADPPIDLTTHPATRALVDEDSPRDDRRYKHREDLIDAGSFAHGPACCGLGMGCSGARFWAPAIL